jgi:hypothetical protein
MTGNSSGRDQEPQERRPAPDKPAAPFFARAVAAAGNAGALRARPPAPVAAAHAEARTA